MFHSYQEIIENAEKQGLIPKCEPGNYKKYYVQEREEIEAIEKNEDKIEEIEDFQNNSNDIFYSILRKQDKRIFKNRIFEESESESESESELELEEKEEEKYPELTPFIPNDLIEYIEEEKYYSDFKTRDKEKYNLSIDLFEEQLNNFLPFKNETVNFNREIELTENENNASNISLKSIYVKKESKEYLITSILKVFALTTLAASIFLFASYSIATYISNKTLTFLPNCYFHFFFLAATISGVSALFVSTIVKINEDKEDFKNKSFKGLGLYVISNIGFIFLSSAFSLIIGSSYHEFISKSGNLNYAINGKISVFGKIFFIVAIGLISLAALSFVNDKIRKKKLNKNRLSALMGASFALFMYSVLLLEGHNIKNTTQNIHFASKNNNIFTYSLVFLITIICLYILFVAIKTKAINEEYYHKKDKNINKITNALRVLCPVMCLLLNKYLFSSFSNFNLNILIAFSFISFSFLFKDSLKRLILCQNNETLTMKKTPRKFKIITNIICPILFLCSTILGVSASLLYYSRGLETFTTPVLILFFSSLSILGIGLLLKSSQLRNKKINLDDSMHIPKNIQNINNDNSFIPTLEKTPSTSTSSSAYSESNSYENLNNEKSLTR